MKDTPLRNMILDDGLRPCNCRQQPAYTALKLLLFLICLVVPAAFAQQHQNLPPLKSPLQLKHLVLPLKDMDLATAKAQAAAGTTIPLWSAYVTYGGTTYPFIMVGNTPLVPSTNQTASVPAPLVNIAFHFTDETVLDPTASDPCSPAGSPYALTVASPLYKSRSYTWGGTYVGATQYIDAFQRANFWVYTQPGSVSPNYHVLLGATQNWKVQVNVPSTEGYTQAAPCGRLGVVSFNLWFSVLSNLFPALNNVGVGSTMFPIFLFHNVILVDPSTGAAASGYHSAFQDQYGGLQTYAVAEYDTSKIPGSALDIAPLSHEVGEWMNDPLGTNPTPPWGHTGQVTRCQNNLEVGDPLSGNAISVLMPNGFTYHPQQLAFFSWFYHGVPSLGINGWYSNLGKFTSPPPICQ